MSEERDIRDKDDIRMIAHDYLLLNRGGLPIKQRECVEWIKIPEFMHELIQQVSMANTINNNVVLSAMLSTYHLLYERAKKSHIRDRNYCNLKRDVNKILRILKPDQYDELKITEWIVKAEDGSSLRPSARRQF